MGVVPPRPPGAGTVEDERGQQEAERGREGDPGRQRQIADRAVDEVPVERGVARQHDVHGRVIPNSRPKRKAMTTKSNAGGTFYG